MRVHGLRDAFAGQESSNRNLLQLDGSRIIEKPADQHDPQPAAEVAVENLQGARKNKQEGEKPPDICSDSGRSVHASRDRPYDGPKHPTAIEWISGYQVEQKQRHVDVSEIFGDAQQGLGAG